MRKTVLTWASETLVKLGLVLGIITALITIFTDTNPAEMMANVSVIVENTVEFTQEAKDFPLTADDVRLLRAWLCKELPEECANP